MTGACGPYNLGGSATEWYQSDRYKVFVVLFYKNFKMIWMTKFNLINLVQIASDLSYFFLTISYLIKRVLCGGVVILLCPI